MSSFSLIKSFGQDFSNSPLGIQTVVSQLPPPAAGSLSSVGFQIGSRWYTEPTNQWYVFGSGQSWTLQNTGGGGMNQPLIWVTVTSNQGMSTNTGYLVIPSGTQVSLTLPLTSAVGDQVQVLAASYSLGAPPVVPGFVITQGAGQQILQGNTMATTLGPAGSLEAVVQGQSVALVCVVANTTWNLLPTGSGSVFFN